MKILGLILGLIPGHYWQYFYFFWVSAIFEYLWKLPDFITKSHNVSYFVGFRETYCESEQESSTWAGDWNGSESGNSETERPPQGAELYVGETTQGNQRKLKTPHQINDCQNKTSSYHSIAVIFVYLYTGKIQTGGNGFVCSVTCRYTDGHLILMEIEFYLMTLGKIELFYLHYIHYIILVYKCIYISICVVVRTFMMT